MTHIIRKITDGWVDQRFDAKTGKLLFQEFNASDTCEYEGDGGERIALSVAHKLYHPFDMVQPARVNELAHHIQEALSRYAPEGVVIGEELEIIANAIWDFERKQEESRFVSCKVCDGRGWLKTECHGHIGIRRCDTCQCFSDDNAAMNHVVNLAVNMNHVLDLAVTWGADFDE